MIVQSVTMASDSSRIPLSLSKCKTCEDWLRFIKFGRPFTDLGANRQGSEAALSLEEVTLDAVIEVDDEEITNENGVDAIIERLKILFKKASKITKYQALEAFETFRKPATMSIQVFLN